MGSQWRFEHITYGSFKKAVLECCVSLSYKYTHTIAVLHLTLASLFPIPSINLSVSDVFLKKKKVVSKQLKIAHVRILH